ncbi:MAG: maleylpyruvate isomerase N-terminal domain-containing protein [Rhodothermales bacterium]
MQPVEPIFTVELFPPLYAELLALLRNLSDDDWEKSTVARLWAVKDIVAHLLDGDIRRLSFQRDHLAPLHPDAPIEGYRDLVDFLNQMNADWVKAARRISPPLLITFLEMTGPQVYAFFKTLDPFAEAIYPVAWAGDEQSPHWFDLAREYTEKWHHQQQIRDAVGAPGLTDRTWLFPVIDTFLRGLPHRYRDVDAADGTRVSFVITGEAGGTWTLCKDQPAWRLYTGEPSDVATRVRLDQDTAWRLFTKGLSPEEARSRIFVGGDEALGERILNLVAVIA